MKKKISIYIPVFNGEKTIKKAIDSVLKQTIKFDEIIVVNDKSTDNTLKILKTIKKIKIINNKKNVGLSKSRNIAIKNCKNNIIANIDADIVLHKKWLEQLVKYLKKGKILMCSGYTKEKFLKNIYNKWRSDRYPLNWGKYDVKNPPFLFGCNSIQYKFLWKKIKGYNDYFKSAGDDVDYGKKISSYKFQTYYSSKAICYHLQNDSLYSLTNRVWRYHSYGYKIKNISFYRFLKLIIKQFKFFSQRLIDNIYSLNFKYIYIDFIVLINFVFFEIKQVLSNLWNDKKII